LSFGKKEGRGDSAALCWECALVFFISAKKGRGDKNEGRRNTHRGFGKKKKKVLQFGKRKNRGGTKVKKGGKGRPDEAQKKKKRSSGWGKGRSRIF